MIVYQSTKDGFNSDILSGDIENIILANFKEKLHRSTSKKEVRSWKESLHYMNTVLSDQEIPHNSGVCIEYQIPQTSNRIDFIIAGKNENDTDYAVVIELKQWSTSELTEKDAIVTTPLGRGYHETNHPSYQAWSYVALLQDFNETIYTDNIQLKPCAYLHNYEEDKVIRNPFYQEHLDKAPVFLKKDIIALQNFIKQYVKYGDDGQLLYRIDKGKIKPSKMLTDSLKAMLEGNKEFIMIDDQKVAFENAIYHTKSSEKNNKKVLIIEGGPGTGKSVIAINLLVEITRLGKLVQYVTKNAAPRAVYEKRLTGSMTKSRISNLFKGSGSYFNSKSNVFDALVVDEAHRLMQKSGLFKNLGENQIKEIINSAKCSIFFIDEDQRVTFDDIGTNNEIKSWAKQLGCDVIKLKLESQFRCNGSEGYLAWIDEILQIRQTANTDISEFDYDFKVLSDPNELRELIINKNKINNRSRLVAGYCWDWISKRSPQLIDIKIPEHNFEMRWNLSVEGGLWITMPDSINEIGCIHTCQGLEVDYIGVIIGPDLIVRDGNVLVDPSKRSKMDQSIRGYKKMLKENPEEAKKRTKMIIKNTYRTLMTRGLKGCYIYLTDKETEEYFKAKLENSDHRDPPNSEDRDPGISMQRDTPISD